MPLADGTLLGRYEIRSHLGAGGMGEVYLALDSQLERTVALKILPAEVGSDPQRMQRFMQEARTASALNHPNIITIYEIGQTDSTHFIATEFIDGVTLRERMTSARLELSEALEIAIQVASALAAAHAAGIVHRDIKPENIMVRPDGYVKVLDFGLAKPTERERPALDTEAPTKALVHTEPGKVMGTVSYMSPEQARGDELDARTDIWSFGVVLYEMIAGHKPFEGATPSHVIVSILDREPPHLTGSVQGAAVPAELQLIVKKALRKDVEARYQTIKDLLSDLRSLKQELEFESKLERSTPPELSGSMRSTTISGQSGFGTVSGAAARTVELGATPTSSSGASLAAASATKRSARPLLFVAISLLAVAGLAGMLYTFLHHRAGKGVSAPFQSIKITRLTTTGKATGAAISPDGKYVVYRVSDGEQHSLWVRQVVTNSNVPIVPPSATARYLGATFSRDGDYIYYVKKEQNSPVGELFQVAALGGDSRKIINDIDTAITFSPDGKRLAFMRGDPNTKEVTLITANADGTEEKKISSRQYPLWWDAPAWSPDGKVIACLAWSKADLPQVSVVEVPAEGGAEKTIAAPGRVWWRSQQLMWLSDGSGLIANAPAEEAPTSLQIWLISYPGGATRRITNDLNFYGGVSLTKDSTALVTVQVNEISNLWIVPQGDAARARQITSGADNYLDPVFTPDGKIVYVSMISGNPDIWMMDQDGNNQKQLTTNKSLDIQPSVSPDGRYIVFISDRDGGTMNIWRMDMNGGNPKQLTNGKGGLKPQCTPDGQWVVYSTAGASGNPSLWKVSIEGGEPLLITDKHTSSPVISPDGKLIACSYWDLKDMNTRLRIALFPIEGGEPVKTFDMPDSNVRWMADGRALTYIDSRGGVSNLWMQPIDGSKPRQLTNFTSDRIFNYVWSSDGKQLLCSRGTVNSDVVLISDFNRVQNDK